MKPILAVIFFIFIVNGCDMGGSDDSSGSADKKPYLGILQFKVDHNLADDSCFLAGDCHLAFETDEENVQAWLEEIRKNSNMAVLHWDRSIPWDVFAENPPSEFMRISFYDQRLDSGLLAWINAFRDHFEIMERGYLAVSFLHSERNRVKEMYVGTGDDVEITEECPDMSPGMQIKVQYDDGTGTQQKTFNLETAYLNFLLYLYEKLKPDYLAIMVEANLFKRFCPDKWSGLVSFYHSLYDKVRVRISDNVRIFATMAYTDLLKYDVNDCYDEVEFELCPCSGDPPGYDTPYPAVCYPIDMSAVDDFNQGERLEILALSFYPDGLLMSIPGYDDNLIYVYPNTWDGSGAYYARAMAPPFIDPSEYLAQLGWNKPIAMAETSARSCRTVIWYQDELSSSFVQLPGGLFTQAFWLDLILSEAKEHEFEFYVQSFLRDYDVVGPWTLHEGLIPYDLYSLFNTWPCSGIYDKDGNSKVGVTDVWLDALE